MENNKNNKSVKFQGDMFNFCDFIQVYVFTTNLHLKRSPNSAINDQNECNLGQHISFVTFVLCCKFQTNKMNKNCQNIVCIQLFDFKSGNFKVVIGGKYINLNKITKI